MILSAVASSTPGSLFNSALPALLMSTSLTLAAALPAFALAPFSVVLPLPMAFVSVAGTALLSAAKDRLAPSSNTAAVRAGCMTLRFMKCLLDMIRWSGCSEHRPRRPCRGLISNHQKNNPEASPPQGCSDLPLEHGVPCPSLIQRSNRIALLRVHGCDRCNGAIRSMAKHACLLLGESPARKNPHGRSVTTQLVDRSVTHSLHIVNDILGRIGDHLAV